MFFEISSEIGVLQQILTWYCTVAQISFSANSCPSLWQGLIFDFANTFSADNATPSAYYWRKVAQGRTLYTLTVELSTWLSCSLHSSFVAQMLWHGWGVYIADQRCEILTNKFESLGFCWLFSTCWWITVKDDSLVCLSCFEGKFVDEDVSEMM